MHVRFGFCKQLYAQNVDMVRKKLAYKPDVVSTSIQNIFIRALEIIMMLVKQFTKKKPEAIALIIRGSKTKEKDGHYLALPLTSE